MLKITRPHKDGFSHYNDSAQRRETIVLWSQASKSEWHKAKVNEAVRKSSLGLLRIGKYALCDKLYKDWQYTIRWPRCFGAYGWEERL